MLMKDERKKRVKSIERNHAQEAHDVPLVFRLCVELKMFVDEVERDHPGEEDEEDGYRPDHPES